MNLMFKLPSQMQKTVSKSVPCGICLESFSNKATSTCSMNHQFCTSCFPKYVNNRLSNNVFPLKCPGWHECNAVLHEAYLKQVLSEQQFTKFIAAKNRAFDPQFRQCDRCAAELDFGSQATTTHCNQCGTMSCFSHGAAHPYETCQAFIARTRDAQSERATRATIRRVAKKCPTCKTLIEKDGGCDHMYCTRCRTSWNWSRVRSPTDTRDELSLWDVCVVMTAVQIFGGLLTAACTLTVFGVSLAVVFSPIIVPLLVVHRGCEWWFGAKK